MSLWVRWGAHAACAPPPHAVFPTSRFITRLIAAIGSVVLALAVALTPGSANATPPERAAYVISANDASVTRVDLDTGDVLGNLMSLGVGANRIELSPDLAWAAVVNSGSDTVTLLDLAAESVLSTVSLPTGANPWTAEIHEGRVFVTALLHDLVYEVDPVAGVVDSFPVGKAPEGMAVAAGRLFVANTGFDFGTFAYDPGTVTVLDATSLAPVATVPVATNPQECLVAPDGTVHVVCTGDFGAVTGVIQVIDPVSLATVATIPVDAYPGGGCVVEGCVLLNTTTPSFGSEVRGYDATSLAWVWDGANPLLPSFDFYGNLRALSTGRFAICDFSADLLLQEDPDAPGAPQASLVGDGPIDLAVVERGGTVSIAVSGLQASDSPLGVRVSWNAALELSPREFSVERADTPGEWRAVTTGLVPARSNVWVDRQAPGPGTLHYRVGMTAHDGARTFTGPVTIVRRPTPRGRLALRRIAPNPSRGAARIDFFAPRAGDGTLELFDVGGRRVANLAVTARGGEESFRWDGRGSAGRAVPAGAYFARLTLHGESSVARVLRAR